MDYGATLGEETRYASRLKRLFADLLTNAGKASSIDEFARVIKAFTFSPEMRRTVRKMAISMISHRQAKSAATWREAAMRSMNSGAVRQALKEEMQGPVGALVRQLSKEFAEDISSLPQKVAEETTAKILEWTQQGMRPAAIVKELGGNKEFLDTLDSNIKTRLSKAEKARFEREGATQEDILKYLKAKHKRAVNNRIKTIARTECSKANEALQEARCERLGITAYFWRTAKDGPRVRKSHQKMEGVICFWDDPPAPEGDGNQYHAGRIYNCRCYSEPIVSWESLTAQSYKVWYKGVVRTMSRRELMKIAL